MKKWVYYILIFVIVCLYFYVGNGVSSYWEAVIKYEKKIKIDLDGREVLTLSVGDFMPGDFCVILDTLGERRYFRVVGMTVDSLICVNFGANVNKLPLDIETSSTIVSSNFFIDNRVNWIEELLQEETNFSDELVLYDAADIKHLLKSHSMILYHLNDNFKHMTTNLWMKLKLAYPSVLGLVVILFFIIIFGYNKLFRLIISKNKDTIKFTVVSLSILFFSYFYLKFVVFTV